MNFKNLFLILSALLLGNGIYAMQKADLIKSVNLSITNTSKNLVSLNSKNAEYKDIPEFILPDEKKMITVFNNKGIRISTSKGFYGIDFYIFNSQAKDYRINLVQWIPWLYKGVWQKDVKVIKTLDARKNDFAAIIKPDETVDLVYVSP